MPRTEPASSPSALLLLANLGRPRRPTGATVPYSEPVLPHAAAASAQLAGMVDQPVTTADLADLRRLQQFAVDAAEAALAGKAVDCAVLNEFAAGCVARVELVVVDAALRQRLAWTDSSVTAALARRLVGELGSFEPGRLRRCARPECDLLFYDTTRSRTRRWHAEEPCGWRERQRVHRGRQAAARPSAVDR